MQQMFANTDFKLLSAQRNCRKYILQALERPSWRSLTTFFNENVFLEMEIRRFEVGSLSKIMNTNDSNGLQILEPLEAVPPCFDRRKVMEGSRKPVVIGHSFTARASAWERLRQRGRCIDLGASPSLVPENQGTRASFEAPSWDTARCR